MEIKPMFWFSSVFPWQIFVFFMSSQQVIENRQERTDLNQLDCSKDLDSLKGTKQWGVTANTSCTNTRSTMCYLENCVISSWGRLIVEIIWKSDINTGAMDIRKSNGL